MSSTRSPPLSARTPRSSRSIISAMGPTPPHARKLCPRPHDGNTTPVFDQWVKGGASPTLPPSNCGVYGLPAGAPIPPPPHVDMRRQIYAQRESERKKLLMDESHERVESGDKALPQGAFDILVEAQVRRTRSSLSADERGGPGDGSALAMMMSPRSPVSPGRGTAAAAACTSTATNKSSPDLPTLNIEAANAPAPSTAPKSPLEGLKTDAELPAFSAEALEALKTERAERAKLKAQREQEEAEQQRKMQQGGGSWFGNAPAAPAEMASLLIEQAQEVQAGEMVNGEEEEEERLASARRKKCLYRCL